MRPRSVIHSQQETFRAWSSYDTRAEALLRNEPLYGAILDAWPLRRLRNISFMGAMEYFSDGGRRGPHQSRYNHTVGVAYLTHRACSALSLRPRTERLLVAAAILHDVGHGALSHSIEPYFRSRFNVCHKHFGERIVRGDLFLGAQLKEILGDYGLDIRRVARLMAGETEADGGYLFSLPINVDTLDGIPRAASFFEADWTPMWPDKYLAALIDPSPRTAPLADRFWTLKEHVYGNFIQHDAWSTYDHMLSLALVKAESQVNASDFLLTDEEFHAKFDPYITTVQRLFQEHRSELEHSLQPYRARGPSKRRRFVINKAAGIHSRKSFLKRYLVRRE